MRFSIRTIALFAILSTFAFGQADVPKQEPPALLQDSTGTPMKIDFMQTLAGVNDPGMLFAHFAGKPLIIYYFSPKCPHCQASFPEIQNLIKAYEPKGLTGVGISIGGGIKKNDVRLFIDQFNASFPIFQDVNAKFGPAYGTGYVPVVFIVNKDGTFYRFGDLYKKSFERIESLLKKLYP